MSWNYEEVDPRNEHKPEEFKQAIQSFNDFLERFDESIENQNFESDKEELEELRSSLSDTVEVFAMSNSFQVVFEDTKEIPTFKFGNGFTIDKVSFEDSDLELRGKMRG